MEFDSTEQDEAEAWEDRVEVQAVLGTADLFEDLALVVEELDRCE